jgi:hypothetical protein
MAFTKTTETDFGFAIVNAYQRVEEVNLISKEKLFFHLRSYKDIDKPSFATLRFECPYSLDGPNPIKQAYLHLKTLPEFADAIDC